jgi:hypothetical protein
VSDSPAKKFLKDRGRPSPSEPVKIHLLDDSGTQQTEAEGAPAVFRFVSDKVQTDAAVDAGRAIAALEEKGPVAPEIRTAYEHAYLLHAILRDPAAPLSPFFDGPEEVRTLIPATERVRLIGTWQTWMETKFPGDFSSEKFKEAMADAESFTLKALLTKYGYATTRNCVISSAVTLSSARTAP